VLVEQAAVEFRRRQEWIAQVEPSIMEFAHAARNGIYPRFQFRRDMAPCVAPVAVQAERKREDPAALSAGQPIEHRGFARIGHETLENNPLTGR